MNPLALACLTLFGLVVCLGLVGMLLVRLHWLRVRSAALYTRLCTGLVLGVLYGLTLSPWPGLHLRPIDFWSLVVIVAIVAYAIVWAAVAFQLNRTEQAQFGDSFMLSMLYTDSQQHPQPDFEPTQVADPKRR